MYTQCTKKLADAMKIKVEKIDEENQNDLFCWHANLFSYNRRKGVLLMNNQTRYAIVLYGLKMEHFKRFDEIVLDAMKENFLLEGIPMDQIQRYIDLCAEISYVKTNNRSVLGQINDFEFMLTNWLHELSLDSLNQPHLGMELSHTPLWKFKSYPNRMLKEALAK